MSEQEARDRGLRLVPAWWPIVTGILAAACAVGANAATNQADNSYQDRRLNLVEMRVDRLEKTIFDTNDRLARIEGALGVKK